MGKGSCMDNGKQVLKAVVEDRKNSTYPKLKNRNTMTTWWNTIFRIDATYNQGEYSFDENFLKNADTIMNLTL